MVCSYPLGMQALEFPKCCRPGSATTYVLPGATQPEQQSNLQMAPTCAGLGGFQASQTMIQSWLLLVPSLGLLSQRYGSWLSLHTFLKLHLLG